MEQKSSVGPSRTLSRWALISDYLFGRNALIGIASLMLLVISGYATWSGMNDFIIGVQSDGPADAPAREVGTLSISAELLVISVVVALTFLMWLALRETFGAQRRVRERLVTLPLYIFLAIWSIGFGYGFWWSLIAGQEATRTSLSGLQEDARDASAVVAARLDAVNIQLGNVVAWSESQMSREENSGGSCGVSSGAGQGPLYNARKTVRDAVTSLRDSIKTSWLVPVQKELEILKSKASGLQGATVAERKKNFERTAREIRGSARNIAARSNALGQSTASGMNSLADLVSIAPGKVGFSCYDPTLAQRLRQAAKQASEPAVLKLRNAAFNEGPAGVANAVKDLWANLGSYAYHLPNYILTGQTSETASTKGITGRDLIAFLATLGIDLGLLALTILNPPSTPPIRNDGLSRTQAHFHIPPGAVVRQITGAINTAIARAPGANMEWVRKHFVYHDGASYFVIPNLYSVSQKNEQEALRALAMNQLAGVLDDLDLIRTLRHSELSKARKEEQRESRSVVGSENHMKNHGLLSKCQRALDVSGWSKDAQKDIEVFRLTDTEGLTPLLIVLNESPHTSDNSPKPNVEITHLGEEKKGEGVKQVEGTKDLPKLEDKSTTT
ncbi:MAG: hypothetical protein ACRBBN_13265 [Methyloligellaceae bacterium]